LRKAAARTEVKPAPEITVLSDAHQRHTPDADMVRMRFEAAHLGRSLAIVDHAGDALGGRPVR
jgi:hypothetical protein